MIRALLTPTDPFMDEINRVMGVTIAGRSLDMEREELVLILDERLRVGDHSFDSAVVWPRLVGGSLGEDVETAVNGSFLRFADGSLIRGLGFIGTLHPGEPVPRR